MRHADRRKRHVELSSVTPTSMKLQNEVSSIRKYKPLRPLKECRSFIRPSTSVTRANVKNSRCLAKLEEVEKEEERRDKPLLPRLNISTDVEEISRNINTSIGQIARRLATIELSGSAEEGYNNLLRCLTRGTDMGHSKPTIPSFPHHKPTSPMSERLYSAETVGKSRRNKWTANGHVTERMSELRKQFDPSVKPPSISVYYRNKRIREGGRDFIHHNYKHSFDELRFEKKKEMRKVHKLRLEKVKQLMDEREEEEAVQSARTSREIEESFDRAMENRQNALRFRFRDLVVSRRQKQWITMVSLLSRSRKFLSRGIVYKTKKRMLHVAAARICGWWQESAAIRRRRRCQLRSVFTFCVQRRVVAKRRATFLVKLLIKHAYQNLQFKKRVTQFFRSVKVIQSVSRMWKVRQNFRELVIRQQMLFLLRLLQRTLTRSRSYSWAFQHYVVEKKLPISHVFLQLLYRICGLVEKCVIILPRTPSDMKNQAEFFKEQTKNNRNYLLRNNMTELVPEELDSHLLQLWRSTRLELDVQMKKLNIGGGSWMSPKAKENGTAPTDEQLVSLFPSAIPQEFLDIVVGRFMKKQRALHRRALHKHIEEVRALRERFVVNETKRKAHDTVLYGKYEKGVFVPPPMVHQPIIFDSKICARLLRASVDKWMYSCIEAFRGTKGDK